jgi:hypothetical protein
MTSCSVAPHPNEQLIVGTWKTIKVEKIIDPSAPQAAPARPVDTARQKSMSGRPGGDNTGAKREATLDRMVQAEMRATMEILPNKTAVKNFHNKPIHLTWKMKGKGTRIVAKNVENNRKFVIEILEISKERIVVIEETPLGDLKIVYERQ